MAVETSVILSSLIIGEFALFNTGADRAVCRRLLESSCVIKSGGRRTTAALQYARDQIFDAEITSTSTRERFPCISCGVLRPALPHLYNQARRNVFFEL